MYIHVVQTKLKFLAIYINSVESDVEILRKPVNRWTDRQWITQNHTYFVKKFNIRKFHTPVSLELQIQYAELKHVCNEEKHKI